MGIIAGSEFNQEYRKQKQVNLREGEMKSIIILGTITAIVYLGVWLFIKWDIRRMDIISKKNGWK